MANYTLLNSAIIKKMTNNELLENLEKQLILNEKGNVNKYTKGNILRLKNEIINRMENIEV